MASTSPTPPALDASFSDRSNGLLSRYSDLLLAGAVVLIIGILVIRIPPGFMDYLLAVNIAVSALVLLVALYIPDATRLPSFPTILLLTTLFRLALNVSSTRLILLEANAGEIISAFGNFVVQGNYVVGGVIFLVLVLVQFIVVAKGSERVAEVAARFTLDAMPGKQMSIDADMRNGLIGPDEARQRRQALERESKLYGAMDGAMKFVKGDAIAGIVISLINVIGGMVIGVLQQGMSAGEAAQVYSLLTIGDGLVSQIPALLICVSAGLVVTRVAASESKGSNIGRDIVDQVLAQPKAVAVVGLLLVMIGLTSQWTGFPLVPFVALGAVAGIISVPLLLVGGGPEALPAGAGVAGAGAGAGEKGEEEPAGMPRRLYPLQVVLEVGSELERLFVTPEGQEEAQARRMLEQIREHLSEDLGLPLPPINVRIESPHLLPMQYAILVYDCPVGRAMIASTQAMALCSAQHAASRSLQGVAVSLPWGKAQVCVIPAAQAEAAQKAGIPVLSALALIRQHLLIAIRRNAAEFMGIQEASSLLERLKQKSPDLVKATVPTQLNIQQVTEVLQRLLREQVPVRDLRAIIESLARWGQTQKNPQALTELVRRDLRRLLCTQYAVARQRLEFYAVDFELEQVIQEATHETAQGIVVRPSYADQERIVQAFESAIDLTRHHGRNPVVLTRTHIRRPLRTVIEQDLPDVMVLSYDELSPEFAHLPVGKVALVAEGVEEPAGVAK